MIIQGAPLKIASKAVKKEFAFFHLFFSRDSDLTTSVVRPLVSQLVS